MSVGFNSTTFTGTETVGHAVVCVEVLNPPSGGAIQPFSLTILPGEGLCWNDFNFWHYDFHFQGRRFLASSLHWSVVENCNLRREAPYNVMNITLPKIMSVN